MLPVSMQLNRVGLSVFTHIIYLIEHTCIESGKHVFIPPPKNVVSIFTVNHDSKIKFYVRGQSYTKSTQTQNHPIFLNTSKTETASKSQKCILRKFLITNSIG